ncbi:MAG: hypothetical protein ISS11_07485, partial [Candidatus Marinimicrobia bacterium]|nr:hypothetical protein [Candidatus Neomarinimicrobiota bacterium]
MKYLYYLTIVLSFSFIAFAQEDIEYIDSDSCVDCHEESKHNTAFEEAITNSVHEDLECLDCHTNKETVPHQEELEFDDACEGCRSCHDGVSDQYQAHGRSVIGSCEDMPHCFDCHGSHDVLPSEMKNSKTHPVNLPNTCGKCHENLNITQKYDILIDHPIEIYEGSVHGKASMGGIYVAATCNDCHSSNGSAHKILSPGEEESSINHFKIPNTCGQCHKGIENDFWEGIHGQLVARGETDAPVCTDCHGEHGIISPDDPKSPVSSSRVAKETCSPCHDSAVLNEKYGLPAGKLTSFIDSYHGLKSKAGDSRVANCSSCHGVHRILPSSDSTSSIYPSNLQYTCGECHPGISEELAASPIHGITGQGLRTPVAGIVEDIYIAVIVFTIGFMLIHWFLDLTKQIRKFMKKPQVRRMRPHEVWQHTCLMLSFIA